MKKSLLSLFAIIMIATTIQAQINIISFIPTSAGAGTTVTIYTGSIPSVNVSAVMFGGISAASFTVGLTSISAVVPSGAISGKISITACNFSGSTINCGTVSKSGFTYLPSPIIKSFTPKATSKGKTDTLFGINFNETTEVNFGGTLAKKFTVLNDSTIIAVLGVGASGSVSVRNKNGIGSLGGFQYLILPPVINSFTPTTAITGNSVIIKGDNYTGTSNVSFGNISSTSFNVLNDSTITAVVDTGESGNISVTTSYGIGYKVGFTYLPPPKITSFSPSTASMGDSITIHGLRFMGATAVSFGDTAAYSYKIVNDSTIISVVGAGNSGNLSVTDSNGTGRLSGFKYLGPTISSFTPSSICPGNIAYLTILGNKFSNVTSVKVGGVPVSAYLIINDTTIVATIQANTVGKIIVSSNNGIATSRNTFINAIQYTAFEYSTGGSNVSVTKVPNSGNVASIFVGSQVGGICASPDGTTVYVADASGAGTVSVINTSTNTRVSTIRLAIYSSPYVLAMPYGVSVSGDGSKIYVTEFSGNVMCIIQTAGYGVIKPTTPSSMNNYSRAVTVNVNTCSTQLPISLTKIIAEIKNNCTAIKWQTATEYNTSNFIIQHSTDGSSFTDIGKVKAMGSGANGYSFTDNTPTNGINYYRLQSVDKDGSISYSKTISVQLSSLNSQLSIFPNPAKDRATISFGKLTDKAIITVYDITGKAIITQQINNSTNTYQLNTQKLTKGIYIVKVKTATGSVNGKLVIER